MDVRESAKRVLSFSVNVYGKLGIVCASIAASAVMAYAAGYSLADFVTPGDESGGSSGGSNSGTYRDAEFNYGRLINLGGMLSISGGNYRIKRYDRVMDYSFTADGANNRYAALISDGVVKNSGTPAGTQGNAGSMSRAVFPDDSTMNSFEFPAGSTFGWNTNADKAGKDAGPITNDSATSGHNYAFFPMPDGGGAINGQSFLIPDSVTPTPLPAALPLFGSGLAFLWILRRKLAKST